MSRILAFFFLIISFAHPYIPYKNEDNQKEINSVFIYIDNSFSMDADYGDGRLLDIAKEKARLIIRSYENKDFYFITNDFENKHNRTYSSSSIEKEIDNTESSSSIKSIKTIINKRKTLTKKYSHMYIISDMQKSTMRLEDINEEDTNNLIFLVPIFNKAQDNISIDSCWINNPIITSQENIEIFTNISNRSKKKIKDQAIQLKINNKLKSQKFITLDPNEEKEVKFNITYKDKGDLEGELLTNDSPNTFDNNLLFTIKRNNKVNISCINDKDENSSINSLFANDTSTYNYTKFPVNNIDYNIIANQDLLILNKIESINSATENAIKQLTENGKSIIIIPPTKINIEEYNKLLNKLGVNTIKSIIQDTQKISNINTYHKIFNQVFDGKVDNINYPLINEYIVTNNSKSSRKLLSCKNNQPFLSLYQIKSGLIYLFSNSITKEQTNFTKHALFVPTLLNIATQSITSNQLYNTIGLKDYFISTYKKTNKLIHLTNNQTDIIPTVKTYAGETYYYIHNQINTSDIYTLKEEKKEIEKIAFNYDRTESKPNLLSIGDIQKKTSKLQNIKIISSSLDNFNQEIQKSRKDKELWKITIILALLFFALETIIIKIIKI